MTGDMIGTLALAFMGGLGLIVAGFVYALVQKVIGKIYTNGKDSK